MRASELGITLSSLSVIKRYRKEKHFDESYARDIAKMLMFKLQVCLRELNKIVVKAVNFWMMKRAKIRENNKIGMGEHVTC